MKYYAVTFWTGIDYEESKGLVIVCTTDTNRALEIVKDFIKKENIKPKNDRVDVEELELLNQEGIVYFLL